MMEKKYIYTWNWEFKYRSFFLKVIQKLSKIKLLNSMKFNRKKAVHLLRPIRVWICFFPRFCGVFSQHFNSFRLYFSAGINRQTSNDSIQEQERELFKTRLSVLESVTCGRIGQLLGYVSLQSYWKTTKPSNLTVVLDNCEAKETYSRIGLLRSYGNLQWY